MLDLLQRVQRSFEPLYGKPCWNAKHGHGSFLTFEFGDPHLEIDEPQEPKPTWSPKVQKQFSRRHVWVRGQWHLWIYCCNWRVTSGSELIGESSTVELMNAAASQLDGHKLVLVSADQASSQWRFDFDLGGCLETWPYPAEADRSDRILEQWNLYEPSGYVLTVRADGAYSYQPGNDDAGADVWVLPQPQPPDC